MQQQLSMHLAFQMQQQLSIHPEGYHLKKTLLDHDFAAGAQAAAETLAVELQNAVAVAAAAATAVVPLASQASPSCYIGAPWLQRCRCWEPHDGSA
jgi:hypothetical protein